MRLPCAGPTFLSLRGIAVEATGQVVVADDGLDAVLRVDPGSGDRTIASRAGSGAGTPFGGPVDIVVEANGQLMVVDVLLGAVLRIDPGSGARTAVSGCVDSVGCADPMGSGPVFRSPQALAVEADGRLVVVDDGRAAVVRVDPATGDRTVVSDASTGSGLPFAFPIGIAVEATGALVVTDFGFRTVVQVDPATGNRTLVSGRGRGGGPLSHPRGILVEADGTLVVVDNALRAVLRVDPATGDRSIMSDTSTGSGPSFVGPVAITVDANDRLMVDALLAAIVQVDPATGDRTLVSRLSLIPATVLAKVPTGAVRIRSIDDFLATQGTFCIDDGQGGCFLLVPPIPNFGGMGDGATNRCVSVDYAGLANATVEDASGGRVSFGTTTQGFVIEQPLADGRAMVAVLLDTQNALTWVMDGCDDFAASPLLFGHRAADVLSAGREPALGDSFLLLVFINTAPDAALPDFIQLIFFPEAGQEWNFLSFHTQADGTLREAFGVPEDTPGRATGRQINIFIPPFVQQNFLLEHIALRPLGE
jgi:streptogramin lyase